MLQGFQSVVRVAIATKLPGVSVPEWWDKDIMPIDLAYGYVGIGISTDDDGLTVTGLKLKGSLFSVVAPWAAVVAIMRPDGSDSEEWVIDPDEMPSPEKDENGVHLLELPRHVLVRDDATKVLHGLLMQLSQMKPEDTARFVLAKLPRGAYTGLKLVVDNTKQRTFKSEPTDPPPLHVA